MGRFIDSYTKKDMIIIFQKTPNLEMKVDNVIMIIVGRDCLRSRM